MTYLLFCCKPHWSCAGLLNRNTLQSQSHHLLCSPPRFTLFSTLIPSQIMANLYLSFPHLPRFCWLHIFICYLSYSCPGKLYVDKKKKKVHRFSEWIRYLCKHWMCLGQELISACCLRHPTAITSYLLKNWVQLRPKHMVDVVVCGRGQQWGRKGSWLESPLLGIEHMVLSWPDQREVYSWQGESCRVHLLTEKFLLPWGRSPFPQREAGFRKDSLSPFAYQQERLEKDMITQIRLQQSFLLVSEGTNHQSNFVCRATGAHQLSIT